MPLDLRAKQAQTKTVTLELDGEEFKATCYPYRLTKDMVAAWQHDPANVDHYTTALPEILASWDVMDGDEPWPITAEALGKLPISLLDVVLGGIAKAVRPGEANTAAS